MSGSRVVRAERALDGELGRQVAARNNPSPENLLRLANALEHRGEELRALAEELEE